MNVLLRITRGAENAPRPILMNDLDISTMVILLGSICGGFGYLVYSYVKKRDEDSSSDEGEAPSSDNEDLLAEKDVQELLDDAIAAAVRGDPGARCKLGVMYAYGAGVPQDIKTAVKWYALAANHGDSEAQHLLGLMYEQGRGVPQDDKTAAKWYTLAADQGLADAQHLLGLMHEDGRGVLQDYEIAVKWLTLAAKQGDADAQFDLAGMYARGQGVPQDDKIAVKWLTLAAENGNSAAEDALVDLAKLDSIEGSH